MATPQQILSKAQTNSRYDKVNGPGASSIRTNPYFGLPSNPLSWYPEYAEPLDFAKDILGSAEVIGRMSNTEAGRQYEEAQKRALRGDVTIDDSGFFTFTKAQHKAISEVEARYEVPSIRAKLDEQDIALKQELEANPALSSAQKRETYMARMEQLYQSYLGNSTKDTDYLATLGKALLADREYRYSNYSDQLIKHDLSNEINRLNSVHLNDLKSALAYPGTAEERSHLIMAALADGRRLYNQSGIPSETAKGIEKDFLLDLVASGDPDAPGILQRLRKFETGDGVTLEGAGLINDRLIAEAENSVVREQELQLRRQTLKQNENASSFAYSYYQLNQQYQAALKNPPGETRDAAVAEVTDNLAELLEKLKQSGEKDFSAEGRLWTQKMLDMLHAKITLGVDETPLNTIEQSLVQSLWEQRDFDGLKTFIQENPDRAYPSTMQTYVEQVLKGDSIKEQQTMQAYAWSEKVLENVKIEGYKTVAYGASVQQLPIMEPLTDPLERKRSKDYKSKQELLLNLYKTTEAENPNASQAELQLMAEEKFYKMVPRLDDAALRQRASKEQIRREMLNVTTTAKLVELVQSIPGRSNVEGSNLSDFEEMIAKLPGISDDQKKILKGMLTPAEAGTDPKKYATKYQVFYPAGETAPERPEHGPANLMNPFLEDKDHWLFIRTVNGDYKQISGEQKVPTEATLLASPIPKGVKIPLSDGRIVKSDKLTEADMALLDDPDLPPYNPESPRYNPQAYPYSNEQMQRFVEFYKQGRYLNLTNTAKPLEEHCVVIPNNKVKEPTYKVVKLKDVPKQYQNRLRTPPFDPDLLLLTDRGQVKTAGELIDRSATWLFSESADANYRMLSHSVIRNYKASSLLERMEFLNSVSGR